jgi:site-specific DNA-methyltransferase (adenine-specific)
MNIEEIKNTVICDDCLNILPNIPDQSIKLVIADCPYNNNCNYDVYKDNLNKEDYLNWCKKWFLECRRIAKRVIVTTGHGNMWDWAEKIERPWGTGCWYKPGNPGSSILGWCCWEPWLYYTTDYKALGGPDTIRATITKQKDTGNHVCPKPLTLFEQFILKTTKVGDTILDPFCGSGTTCLAALKNKRNYIGIDISENYCEISRNRCKNFRDNNIDIFD